MKYTHVIWDFNGTLYDDVDAGIRSVNKMLSDRGLRQISGKSEYRKIFKFPIIDYYRDVGFDFSKEPYEVLAPIWVELYNENSKSSELQTGALWALDQFRSIGISQVLLSATEFEMLSKQIEELGINEYFDEVMGLDNIHAYSKRSLAENWLKNNTGAIPVFIGDTEHDVAVAKAIGAECILVCNGHQSRDVLEKCGCVICDDLYNAFEVIINSK